MEQGRSGALKFIGWLLVLIIAGFLGGTLRTSIKLRGGNPVAEAAPQEKVIQKDTTIRVSHWLFGLIAGKGLELDPIAMSGAAQGIRLVAAEVRTRRSALDLLANTFTIGIYCPVSVSVRTSWLSSVDPPKPTVSYGEEGAEDKRKINVSR